MKLLGVISPMKKICHVIQHLDNMCLLQVLARIEVITDLLDTAINDAQDIMDESYLVVQARIDRAENTICLCIILLSFRKPRNLPVKPMPHNSVESDRYIS